MMRGYGVVSGAMEPVVTSSDEEEAEDSVGSISHAVRVAARSKNAAKVSNAGRRFISNILSIGLTLL